MKSHLLLQALTCWMFLLPATIQAGNSQTSSLIPDNEEETLGVEQEEDGGGSSLDLSTKPGKRKMGTVDAEMPRQENATGEPRTKGDNEEGSQQPSREESKPTQRIVRWGSPHPRSTKTSDDDAPLDAGSKITEHSSEHLGDTDAEKSNINEGTGSSKSKHHSPPGVETVRRWGAGSGPSYNPSKPSANSQAGEGSSIPAFENHRDGFQLTARVYIGEDDQLSHFDDDGDITLPYYDCNAAGSTTSPLSIENAYFRHSIAAPSVWTSDPLDPHPTLVIVLRPFRLELDSGESKDLHAGDVILLEDSMKPGHRMIVMDNHEMTMLFLTLRSPHYATGKDNVSLQTAVTRRSCSVTEGGEPSRSPLFVWNHRRIRLALVGTLALSLSTVTADALAKAAPLWLSVGLGGVCFVASMTVGLTSTVEWSLARFRVWRERQRLYPAAKTTGDDNMYHDADL